MVASATGFSEQRGDIINVSSVEFIDGLDGAEVYKPGILDSLGAQTGTMINALAFVVVAFLVAWFGLRPMVAAAVRPAARLPAPSFEDVQRSLPTPDPAVTGHCRPERRGGRVAAGARQRPNALDDLRQKIRPAPQDRLARMVDLNEERSAQILRKWAAATAEAG